MHTKEATVGAPLLAAHAGEAPIQDRQHGYAFVQDGTLCANRNGVLEAPDARLAHLHALFRASVESKYFVCTGAKSAFSRGAYRFAAYPDLNTGDATRLLHADLVAYAAERQSLPGPFRSFIAVFDGPYFADEDAFERALWAQLQSLHELDAETYDWDDATCSDPESAEYSYSIARTSYFIVGMHPASSRLARQFICPVLVFNAHDQFEELREQGTFDRLSSSIRARDVALHGDVNPNLAQFGSASEARQYSGRPVESGWKCPFQARTRSASENEKV